MKKAGIVLDRWKRDIFIKVLRSAGFSFEELDGPYPDSMILRVRYEDSQLDELKEAVTEAQTKCANSRDKKLH